MPEPKASAALEYAESRYHRVSNLEGTEQPPTNWADRPYRYKFYEQVSQLALPIALPAGLGTLADAARPVSGDAARPAVRDSAGGSLSVAELGGLLRLSCGLLARRIQVVWDSLVAGAAYPGGDYGRGTPSGGGLFPTEMYWVCGPSAPVLPGVYHYDGAHHGLDRLLVGDVTSRVRRALGSHPAAQTDQFLLVSIRFWKNSFKYNDFSYYLTTQDLGCVLGSLRPLLRGLGVEPTFLYWFDDEELSRVLGLDTPRESVFAVIPLPGATGDIAPTDIALSDIAPAADARPLVNKPVRERSREILTFTSWQGVHLAALVGGTPRPPASITDAAATTHEPGPAAIALPKADHRRIDRDLTEVFHNRRSSFGRFGGTPLALADFGILLHETASAGTVHTDVTGTAHGPMTRLMAFVNRVDGIAPGCYAYHQPSHRLTPIVEGDRSGFLQRAYLMDNYNLEQIAALLVVVGRPEAMIRAYGDRGLRILHANAGILTQTAYLTAAALGVGAGAVLGADNVAFNQELGLDGTDERSLSFIMVGPERAGAARFDGQLG